MHTRDLVNDNSLGGLLKSRPYANTNVFQAMHWR